MYWEMRSLEAFAMSDCPSSMQPTAPAFTPSPQELDNKMGFAGFICSIFAFFTCGLLSPVSLIISGMALRKKPKGFAIAGLVISTISLLMAIVMIPMMIAIAVPSFLRAREISRRNACLENLSKLDGAKQQWAIETNYYGTSSPGWAELVGEDKYIRSMPACPAGGTYSLETLHEDPTCTHSHGEFAHVLSDW